MDRNTNFLHQKLGFLVEIVRSGLYWSRHWDRGRLGKGVLKGK